MAENGKSLSLCVPATTAAIMRNYYMIVRLYKSETKHYCVREMKPLILIIRTD